MSKLILHIDDDENVRNSIRRVLKCIDYQVVQFDNKEAGISFLSRQKPHACVFDGCIPKNNYVFPELVRKARELYPDIPITAYSGDERAEADSIALKTHFISKNPIKTPSAINAFETWLNALK